MIITLTLNPAIDESVEVRRISLNDTNRVVAIRRDIGGKGINVARVLKELGYEPLAAGFAPGNFGRMIEDQMVDAGIGCDLVSYAGETRTNINIVDRETHTHTVLAAAGPPVPPEAVQQLRARLLRRVRSDTWLVLAGSIPPRLDPSLHVELIEAVARRGGRTVVDADGPVVRAILDCGALPTMVKMNDQEFARLLGARMDDEPTVLEGARSLHRRGVRSVVVTRGRHGAVAVTRDGEFRVSSPTVVVDSAVGAGDAFLAGLLLGRKQGADWPGAMALAAAAGAAVCMAPGTTLCRARDVHALRALTVAERVAEPSAV